MNLATKHICDHLLTFEPTLEFTKLRCSHHFTPGLLTEPLREWVGVGVV